MINPSSHDHFLFHLYSLGHLQNFRLSVIYFKEFRISLCLRRLSVLCFQGTSLFSVFREFSRYFYSIPSFRFRSVNPAFPKNPHFPDILLPLSLLPIYHLPPPPFPFFRSQDLF